VNDVGVGMDIAGLPVGHPVGTDGIVYSVVVPVFNEEANIESLVSRVTPVLDEVGEPYEILFVDDGSSDRTPLLLREQCEANAHVRAVRFTRNFGQEAAVQAAYLYARGHWILQMDGDLQNPPEEMPKLLAHRDDGYDIVFGVRKGRRDPLFRRAASLGMRWTMRRLLHIELPKDISTFRLMRGATAKLLAQFPERQKFLSALACWVGARHTTVDVAHAARNAGRTKYNLGKLVNHTFDLIVGFSSRPLRLIGLAGFFAGLIGFAFAAWAILERLFWGTQMGWSSIFAAVMAMGGMQLLALSLIGEYVARIFVQAQHRPIFVVAEQFGQPRALSESSTANLDKENNDAHA
jgi:glycosyltransferase involved in cell wall biosynthesis